MVLIVFLLYRHDTYSFGEFSELQLCTSNLVFKLVTATTSPQSIGRFLTENNGNHYCDTLWVATKERGCNKM